MINPLLINVYDPKLGGGASRAAYRLHQGLLTLGINSKLLVQNKKIDDSTVITSPNPLTQSIWRIRPFFDALPLKFYQYNPYYSPAFPLQWLPNLAIHSLLGSLNPDVINLHWIGRGFIPIEALAKFNKPIIWTFHDMWAFTGGCCYSGSCDRYKNSCGSCPLLSSNNEQDISRWVWQRKAKAWQNLNLTIVTRANGLLNALKQVHSFSNSTIKVIPYGLDIEIYQPLDRQKARKSLNLPQDKKLILFGTIGSTTNKRKGFHLLQPAIKQLSNFAKAQEWELIILGASQPQEELDLSLKTTYLGTLDSDLSLATVYAAADVFISASIQDNLPNAIMEALACGTPCVGFNIGGIPDLIEHKQNGYLAHPFSPEDLAKGITWILEDKYRWQSLSINARNKVEQEFTLEKQANRYLSLFREVSTKKVKS